MSIKIAMFKSLSKYGIYLLSISINKCRDLSIGTNKHRDESIEEYQAKKVNFDEYRDVSINCLVKSNSLMGI